VTAAGYLPDADGLGLLVALALSGSHRRWAVAELSRMLLRGSALSSSWRF